MKILAWDTSSKSGAIGAIEWEHGRPGVAPRLRAEWSHDIGAMQSERLLWGIDQALSAARWNLHDVDVFGVGVGPGSFTGLRIGITTARTLAHTTGKPLVGVSSLAALARPVALALSVRGGKSMVVAATDACKGELFALWGSACSVADCAAMKEGDRPGLWKSGVEERVTGPDELAVLLKKKIGTGKNTMKWVVVGEGRTRYPDLWKRLPAKAFVDSPFPFADQVQGRYIALLAWEAFQSGLARDALEVHPRYLRQSDAEIKLKAGLLPDWRAGGRA